MIHTAMKFTGASNTILTAARGKKRMADDGSTSSATSSTGEENFNRGNWTGRLDFLMSCISYAVGLGNIWRFPYLCYRNGGAVFLIPYCFFLFLCGIPLFFMEVSYGQFASLSPITVWKMSPLFKGVGYGMVIISGIVCIYYNIIIAWTLYFLFQSFRAVLPWSTCDNDWNTESCMLHHSNASFYNGTDGIASNVSVPIKKTTPSEEFWERKVLGISSGIEEMGELRLELFGCLALAWLLVFICLIKGIKSSGRVVYVTATFPYLVLLSLLIRGATLPGAIDGIRFYLVPRWEKLLEIQVWREAAMQIFYSIGAGWGALVTMASYNKWHNNCYRDARIVPFMNCGTSVFAGFVIFSIIGYLAHETGSSVEDVVRSGPGVVFVIYPEAVSKLPLPQLWAVLFFLMLLSVGLGSQFAMFQCVISSFCDEFKALTNKRLLVTLVLCVVEFLLGIPCVMQGGMYYLQIMDWYGSTFSLMVITFAQVLVISWIYGVNNFYDDIEVMIGYRPCFLWKVMWCVVTPAVILIVFLLNIVSHAPVTYGDYEYPGWAVGIGWFFALCSIVPLPVIALKEFVKADWSHITPLACLQWWRKTTQHAEDWQPALERHAQEWRDFKKDRYGGLVVTSAEREACLVGEEMKTISGGSPPAYSTVDGGALLKEARSTDLHSNTVASC